MSNPNIMNGGDFALNSFIGHEFEVRELPSTRTGLCESKDQTCRNGFFVVSENDDQGECDALVGTYSLQGNCVVRLIPTKLIL